MMFEIKLGYTDNYLSKEKKATASQRPPFRCLGLQPSFVKQILQLVSWPTNKCKIFFMVI